MQKAQRTYQKDKAKFEEARDSLELNAQGYQKRIKRNWGSHRII